MFTDDITLNEKARGLVAKAPEGYLAKGGRCARGGRTLGAEPIQAALDALAEAEGLSRTKAFQPVRAAVTGSNVSPPLPESLALLGRDRTTTRLRSAVNE